MTAARRARQKQNRADSGRHTGREHEKIPDPKHPGRILSVRCLKCQPVKTERIA